MRWDEPRVLVVIGTLAIHGMLLTAGDAIATYSRLPPEPAPELELFEIEPEPPPPPRLAALVEPVLPAPVPVPQPQPRAAIRSSQPQPQPRAVEPPPQPQPSPQPPAAPRDDGAPTVAMPDLAPSAIGVAVRRGPVNTGHLGRGGSGTGSGSGSGSPEVPPVAPMSIATIKTRALPHGDYSYFGAGKDYPAEAKVLAIEGTIRTRLVVDAAGKVTSATALNRLGHGLDELADRYAHAIAFDPARDTNDQPVASVVVWTFQFTLPH